MNRLTVSLDPTEREALYKAAQSDLRPLREQARWLIRQELVRRGLLPNTTNDKKADLEARHGR